MDRIYILILNWKGWKDTIECLESLLRLEYPEFRIVVCDNNSEDNSLEHIKDWAYGRTAPVAAESSILQRLSDPPVPKPVKWIEYNREEAEAGGSGDDEDSRLVLIQTGANLGFASGNNVGLRYMLSRDDFDYVWILNNDTVVEPDALRHMIDRMKEKPDAGMCGGTIRYYDKTNSIQCLGGSTYNRWLATPHHIGINETAGAITDSADIEHKMAYVSGACMLVSKPFLRNVGLMSEDYFLYYEELDWALRSRGRYSLAYAPEAVVYHKEGGSIGSGYNSREKNRTADYYSLKNRLVVARKYHPYTLPSVYLGLAGALVNRIRRHQWDRVGMILKLWGSRC